MWFYILTRKAGCQRCLRYGRNADAFEFSVHVFASLPYSNTNECAVSPVKIRKTNYSIFLMTADLYQGCCSYVRVINADRRYQAQDCDAR